MTRFMRMALMLGFMAVAGGAVFLASGTYTAMQNRSTTYRYLSDALTPISPPAMRVLWQAPERALDRSVTEADEAQVGTALAFAWRAHAAAMDTGQRAPLADHFSGVALRRAGLSAEQAHEDRTQMVVLEQVARPVFYHLDGSVMQIEAEAVTLRYAEENDGLGYFDFSEDLVVTTLMNETTGWRVFSHERRAARPAVSGDAPALRPIPGGLAGINYYPAKTPWRRFWPEFDDSVVAKDLDLVADLGANAVRIFLPVAAFSEAGMQADMLARLDVFLDLAAARGLWVVPTLFDMKPGYAPAIWSEDVGYLRIVLPVLASSPAVAYVDLKNEPDLDFAAHGAARVEAWVRMAAAMARRIAPEVPLTVGWSNAEVADRAADALDLVSYHDYADPAGTEARLVALRASVPGKPVHVTEIGASSYALVAAMSGSPESQARALADRMDALRDADGVFVWTLHDFEAPDAAAVGGSPWTLRLQANFGLIDRDGAPKPAAPIVSRAFETLRGLTE